MYYPRGYISAVYERAGAEPHIPDGVWLLSEVWCRVR